MAANIKRDYERNNRRLDLTTLVYGKVPPQATELEEAVLGACLLEKETFDTVMEILPDAQCFYADAHQKIYAAMKRMFDKGTTVDLLTITEELRKVNELELIGGAYYLTRLTMSVLSSAHVEAHARIVMEKFTQRELIRISGTVIAEAYEDSTDVFELLDNAESELYKVSQKMIKKDFVRVDKVVRKVIDNDEELMSVPDGDGMLGIYTGNSDLDRLTRGFRPAKLIIIAARPSVGKTSNILNMVHKNCVLHSMPLGFFSLEMEMEELVRSLVSIDCQVDLDKVAYPKARTSDEQDMIANSQQRIAKAPIFFDDTAAITIVELRAKARRMRNKHGIQGIVVDYLQLMKGDDGKSFNREAEISKISRELKALAKELQIPVIALCQLNRDIEKRADNKFKLSDLRESGGIEQDADLIGFLWRPDEEDIKKDPTLEGLGKLTIAKHRGGKKGVVLYAANMSTQTWGDYDRFASIKKDEPPQKPYAGFQNKKAPPPPIESVDDLPF